ncbi:MAG: ATP-binding cassette domain-containing protein [Bacteroidaceae bacterium]|nr:ATP-binding cassette domain-containing protein [Bacteroidaceae bacterium]
MILDYKNVSVKQGESVVLDHVNLQVNEGEMVYLVGAVGSGKTSLMKTMYGELPVEGDQAEILGYELTTLKTKYLPSLRRQLGIVFQDFQLLPDRNVRQNLDFVLRSTGWENKEERNERIAEVLSLVKLEDKLEKRVHELSGGEQQRICIARAFLNNPKMILADEPTGNLDPESGELILAQLDEIRRQNQTAILVSTHNLQWPEYFPGSIYRCTEGIFTKER